ncbi:hypothetical protein SBA4_7260007 [Candidatus Sulfopaludibacter sp. SbA4]|nr:hypothetical protein SBA4_7260007 [Candidatus Sulfopaludibacter sp. SbA4]
MKVTTPLGPILFTLQKICIQTRGCWYYNSPKTSQPATIWWGGPPGGHPPGPPTPWSAFGCGSAALYYSSSISFLLEKIFLAGARLLILASGS